MTIKVSPKSLPLAGRIRWARVQAGYSQERFAATVGTSRRHVMRWERASHPTTPGPVYLRRIADATGQPLELFSDDDDEEAAGMAQDLFAAIVQIVQARANA